MINFIPTLSTVLPIIALGLLILVFSINIYFKIRRKFPVSVNCWFCNCWTKVHYDDRNSYDCPNCLQYNGFTKDGDYNKIIPEQHDELMNKSTQIKNNKSTVTNGLCTLCNNNQQLKIFQLANFVPLVEENYDVEIEHFQEQLEKAYKLCRKCDKVLRKTIEKQNAWIFGNRIRNMYKNGISAVHKISSQVIKGQKISLLSKLNGLLSVIVVFSLCIIIFCNIKPLTKSVAKYVPAAYLPVFKNVVALANPLKPIRIQFLPQFIPYDVSIEPFIVVCCVGLFFQMIGIIWEKYSTTVKLNRILCWIILLLTSWIRFHKIYATYIFLIEVFCCVYLLYTSFNKEEIRSRQKSSNRTMRKIVKNLEHTCSMSDLSDTSDIEDISTSSKKTSISQDTTDLNKSTYSSETNLANHVPVQNHSFNTANNVLNFSMGNYTDLNKSLNNLHLGGLGFKAPSQAFSVTSVPVKRPKPVLSPPKFQNVNSWVAGGFWRNADGLIMPVAQRTNLSRSSSESSGFGSQSNEPFAPHRNNYLGEFDKSPVHSDFMRVFPSPNHLFLPINKPVHSAFYPNLRHNNVLTAQGGFARSPSFTASEPVRYSESYQRKNLFQNWSDKINSQATQSFRDLSLNSNYN